MNLRDTLTQATFWHQPICLSCGEVGEEGDRGDCRTCGEEALVEARALTGFLARLEGEDEPE